VNTTYIIVAFLGIDLADAAQMSTKLVEHEDVARRCKIVHDKLKTYQDAITSLEKVMCVYHVKVLILTHISKSFSSPSSTELAAKFCCLRFETALYLYLFPSGTR
jgi:hypothetical protein